MIRTFEQGVDRKGTDCIKWDFQKLDYGKDGLLPFSIADADWPTCDGVLVALHKRIANGVIGYTDISREYLDTVAGWFERRHQWKIENDWIVETGGIVPAMANALEALTSEGAKVIVQPPVYDPFYSIITATHRTIVKNDLILDETGYHMNYEDLEEKCKEGAEAIILCNPHNPVCRVWTEEELKKVADICHKYNLLVISDEIHWDLMLGGRKHVTMGQFKELYEKLIVCTSCSKSFNVAGLEASNLIVPGAETRQKYRDFLFTRYEFCPNTLGMVAIEAAYKTGEQWLDDELKYLTDNAEYVVSFMKEHLPKVGVADPQGTYLLWFDMRKYGLSSKELIHRIAMEGAGLNGGREYGENYDGFVRMNIACPRAQLKAGLECIERALKNI